MPHTADASDDALQRARPTVAPYEALHCQEAAPQQCYHPASAPREQQTVARPLGEFAPPR
eukprot:3697266-Heterocapsa_arctica.AAC.1